jgi:anti-sigma28 factor (negative regulator of flagellin synthesis)
MENMPDGDREARIIELRRLVQKGEYQIDPVAVAAAIVRDSETHEERPTKDTESGHG